MTFLEKLDLLMEENKINKHKLSELSNVPYSTITNFYKQSYDNIKLSTLKKICDYFGVTMDSMARDEVSEIEYYNPTKKNLHISIDEEMLLQCYRKSDNLSKELALRAVRADEKETITKNQNAG